MILGLSAAPACADGDQKVGLKMAAVHGVVTGRLGEINGILTWRRGEIPITLGNIAAPGHDTGVKDAIDIKAVHLEFFPSTGPQSLGNTVRTVIQKTPFRFGKVSVSHDKVSVPYSISSLPVGLSIELEVKPLLSEGSFERDGNPQGTILEIGSLVTKDFNFHFLPPPS
jgi:hypothetical protein